MLLMRACEDDDGCKVSNLPADSEAYNHFHQGLVSFFGYHHQEAAKSFEACINLCHSCVVAYALFALCHCPNYNMSGDAYYESTDVVAEEVVENQRREGDCQDDLSNYEGFTDDYCSIFPCPYVAHQYAHAGVELIRHQLLCQTKKKELAEGPKSSSCNKTTATRRSSKSKRKNQKKNKRKCLNSTHNHLPNNEILSQPNPRKSITSVIESEIPSLSEDWERKLIDAVAVLTSHPGVHASLAKEVVVMPYIESLRKLYQSYPKNSFLAYLFAESLMIPNAWHLYDKEGLTTSPEVDEAQYVLESSLKLHSTHPGLCHLYIHLCEMSPTPERALNACHALENLNSGHLLHMPSHIYCLMGEYEQVVRGNLKAIEAERENMLRCPDTAGIDSFYFAYIAHSYHMVVYGATMGGMEKIALEVARELTGYLDERLFTENPDLTTYLESYAAMDVHAMVRFGRWNEILSLPLPDSPEVMLYRSASLRYARAIAHAFLGNHADAIAEANIFDSLKADKRAVQKILHNNTVADLFEIDSSMMWGEIAYHKGDHDEAFEFLGLAVELQDTLNFDEPPGKMQPVRHALGGLLLRSDRIPEAEDIFRKDLQLNPKNPWALTGLIQCLEKRLGSCNKQCCSSGDILSSSTELSLSGRQARDESITHVIRELKRLKIEFQEQRMCEWADFDVSVSCQCCLNSNGFH